MEYDASNLPVHLLPLERLFSMVDLRGANPWGVGLITPEDVLAHDPSMGHAPPDNFDWQPEAWDHMWTREDHLLRIWQLVHCPRPETIEPVLLDMGGPGQPIEWPVEDGHHRILASWIRGDDHIRARISGDPARIQRWFGELALAPETTRRKRLRAA